MVTDKWNLCCSPMPQAWCQWLPIHTRPEVGSVMCVSSVMHDETVVLVALLWQAGLQG